MKIVIAVASLRPNGGGPAVALPQMGASLATRGVEPLFWTASGRLHGAAQCPKASVSQVFKADAIHSFGVWLPFNQLVASVAQLARRPIVVCPMGMLEPWSLTQKALKKRIAFKLYQRSALNRADALHATADFEVENLRRLGLKVPIALVSHGVEVPRELPTRTEQNVGGEPVRTALFLSRIHPKKGVLDLVRVWARMRPAGWRLIIAGSDADNNWPQVERVITDAKLESSVVYEGHVSHERKAQLFLSSDLFLLPTYSENFGAAVPEAMAYGLPVITTTGAPWAELIETRSGWWVEPGEDGLQSALNQALALSVSELRAMGQRGRELVVARYSWDSAIRKQIQFYRWLTGADKKPDFVFV